MQIRVTKIEFDNGFNQATETTIEATNFEHGVETAVRMILGDKCSQEDLNEGLSFADDMKSAHFGSEEIDVIFVQVA